MMAASMWRMNWLWRRMAGVLVLCALLLSNEVICQDDSTAAPEVASAADLTAGAIAATDAAAPDAAAPDAATPDAAAPDAATPDAAAPDASAAPTAAVSPTAGGQDPAASVVPGDNPFPATIISVALFADKMDGDDPGTTVAPSDSNNGIDAATDVSSVVKLLVAPGVKCVGKDDIPKSKAVTAVVKTENCEVSKGIIEANPAEWCNAEICNLEIFQDGNTMLLTSDDAKLGTLAEALQSENLKEKLGVKSTETPSSSGSSVFGGVLGTGLLAAVSLIAGILKFQRKADPKGVRLAEEAYPADQENQGNTLVSVAPLIPPPETQEKPSENGESPEAPKTEPAPPPPTNGHSTTKTADTEL